MSNHDFSTVHPYAFTPFVTASWPEIIDNIKKAKACGQYEHLRVPLFRQFDLEGSVSQSLCEVSFDEVHIIAPTVEAENWDLVELFLDFDMLLFGSRCTSSSPYPTRTPARIIAPRHSNSSTNFRISSFVSASQMCVGSCSRVSPMLSEIGTCTFSNVSTSVTFFCCFLSRYGSKLQPRARSPLKHPGHPCQ